MRALAALTLLCLLVASPARAQSYHNSPHVEGDAASVRVYYDQRVNTTHVKKDVFIYNGPKAEEVLAAVRSIVSEQQEELALLVSKDDVESLRGDLLRQLNQRFDNQPDIMESLRTLLDAREPKHRGYWDVSLGLSSVVAGGTGTGGSGRLGGSLDMLTNGEFRQSLGMRLGLEILKRDEWYRDPEARTIEGPYDLLAFHGWLEPSYELWWLGKHVGVQLGLLLGAQKLQAGNGSPYITYGFTLAPQVHLGPEDGTGVRIGVQWRMASMTRPVFDFHGPVPGQIPERNVQHVLLVYAGMFFGLFS